MLKVIIGTGITTVVMSSLCIIFGDLSDDGERTAFIAMMIGFTSSGFFGLCNGLVGAYNHYSRRQTYHK